MEECWVMDSVNHSTVQRLSTSQPSGFVLSDTSDTSDTFVIRIRRDRLLSPARWNSNSSPLARP
jgi:hypothetical protein